MSTEEKVEIPTSTSVPMRVECAHTGQTLPIQKADFTEEGVLILTVDTQVINTLSRLASI